MKKGAKTHFVCSECGRSESKWLGRCPDCNSWNSFQEETLAVPAKGGGSGSGSLGRSAESTGRGSGGLGGSGGKSRPLVQVDAADFGLWDSGLPELNRVLGGGLVPGAAILVGGEPGIGKSTLLLQCAEAARVPGPVLYISGEESAAQIGLRARRLGVKRKDLELLVESHYETIDGVLRRLKPKLVIVDSIQTLYSPEAGSIPGTVNQLKFCSFEMIAWAKENEACVFLIAHVTKGGLIAGPKAVEHMVDTVLHFEQAEGELRLLRGTKNRFGSVDELGLFLMGAKGLQVLENPAELFLVHRQGDLPPGISTAVVYEGSRILLVEIQALTVPAKGGMSRVFSDRVDSARVNRLAAVLEKHLNLRFSDQDIYVNIAGGLRTRDVGLDLPLALALWSARTDQSLPARWTWVGELSLAGEIRPVGHLRRRIKAAADMGFTHGVVPKGRSRSGDDDESLKLPDTLKTLNVDSLGAALKETLAALKK